MSWMGAATWRIALIGSLAMGSASAASAQATPAPAASDVERARALFAEGVELADRRRWEEAAARFREADRLRPSPAIAFNLALTLVRLRRFREADVLLERVVAHAEMREDVRSTARRTRDDIRADVARESEAAGRPRAPAPPPPPRATLLRRGPLPARTAAARIEEDDEGEGSSGGTVGWVVGATLIGGGLVAGAAGIWAVATDGRCAGGRRDADGDCELIHDRMGGGIALLAGAGVGVVAGTLVIALTRGDGEPDERAERDGIAARVTAIPLPGGLAVSVGGRL